MEDVQKNIRHVVAARPLPTEDRCQPSPTSTAARSGLSSVRIKQPIVFTLLRGFSLYRPPVYRYMLAFINGRTDLNPTTSECVCERGAARGVK